MSDTTKIVLAFLVGFGISAAVTVIVGTYYISKTLRGK